MNITPILAAELARIAGAELDLDHGLTFRGQAINEHAIGWFLAGAYAIDVGTEQDGRRILASGQGLAAIRECEATADRVAALMLRLSAAPDGGMVDPVRGFRMALRDLVDA